MDLENVWAHIPADMDNVSMVRINSLGEKRVIIKVIKRVERG
jgi:hypothetical protein